MSEQDDDSSGTAKPGSIGNEAPESRRPPNLDEVFLADDDVDAEEEDTRSVSALDALGTSALELDDETQVVESDELESAPASSARLSAPPGAALSVRAAVSSPPMSVPPIRAPEAAPPPLKTSAEGEQAPSQISAPVPIAEPIDSNVDAADSEPEAAELLEEEELQSETDLDQLFPSRESARALRGSVPPWERKPSSDASDGSQRRIVPTAKPGSAPPPPPTVASRLSGPPPSVRPVSARPPPISSPLPPTPQPDPHVAPKTLVSGPPPSTPPQQFPEVPPLDLQTPSGSRGGLLVVLVVALVALLGGGFWMLETTQPGGLVITVSGPGNRPIEGVKVFLDGELVCRASPCTLAQIEAGSHLVRAEAAGYPATADQAVSIAAGEEAIHNVTLDRGGAGTRLSIATEPPGFKVTIDGKDYGTSPIELSDVAPGEHAIEISREGFETIREQIRIAPSERHSLGPFQPRLLKGKLEVSAADTASGAEVRLNGKRMELPFDVELEADTQHELVAVKRGFERFEQNIAFSEKEPSIEIELDLVPRGSGAGARDTTGGGARERAGSKREPRGAEPVASGQGVANFNSLPASTIVLDGRPLGQTPRMGVKVSPGNHTVLFVHPEKGRKSKTFTIKAGQTRTVSIRF